MERGVDVSTLDYVIQDRVLPTIFDYYLESEGARNGCTSVLRVDSIVPYVGEDSGSGPDLFKPNDSHTTAVFAGVGWKREAGA